MKVFIKIAFISLSINLFYTQTTLAQSKVFNNVYNDYSYKKYASNDGNTYYNNEYFFSINEFKPFEYSIYGRAESQYSFFWEDSILGYSYIVDIDQFGDTINKDRLNFTENSNYESAFSGLQIDNHEYVIGFTNDYYVTNFSNANSTFIKLNSNRDTIFRKAFDYGEDTEFVTIKTNDNGATFQVLGFADVDTFGINYDAFISTIDSNGNLISNIQLGDSLDDFLYALEYLDNGNYLLCGHTFNYGVQGISDIWLLEMQPNGIVVWQKTFGTVNFDRIENSKGMIIKDNHIYIVGRSSLGSTAGYFVKTDMQGNLVTEKKYERSITVDKFVGIQEWDDESFIVVGQRYPDESSTEYYPSGWVLKIDTNGNIIWERIITKYNKLDNNGSEPHHYVADMLVSSDKGILLGGYIIANYITDDFGYYHRNDAWLAKTDSCGYTVGDIPAPFFVIDSIQNNKETHTVHISDQSKNYCTAEIDWGDGSENEFYYAYENNLPLAEKQFQHNYTQDGSYVIKVTTLAGEEYRGYLAPVNIVGVGLEDLAQENGFISLFPNPANEYIVVQNVISSVIAMTKELVCLTQSSREAICKDINDCFTMSIYNLNGKELKSFNLNPKLYQQKIDISTLTNGVYFVNFEVNGELVSTEKLVIAR